MENNEQKSQDIRFGGPIVYDFGTYVLRDDTEIRKDADITPSEAYSLFNVMTGERMEVFAGPKEWAIQQTKGVIAIIKLDEIKKFIEESCKDQGFNQEQTFIIKQMCYGAIGIERSYG